MLEHVFFRGAVLAGMEDFFRQDTAGSGAETSTAGTPLSAFEKGTIERGTVNAIFLPYKPRAIN